MLNLFALSRIHELPTNENEIPFRDGGEDYGCVEELLGEDDYDEADEVPSRERRAFSK